ncbi:MAG: hypothetical protein FWE33_01715 [Defluviitaleaceae bacterium]|nr:hypothetical protein [Defluviitaleaceae bacterium]
MAGTNVGSVYLDLRLDMKELEKGLANAGRLLNGMENDFAAFAQGSLPAREAVGGLSGVLGDLISDMPILTRNFLSNINAQERAASMLSTLSDRAQAFGESAVRMGRDLAEMSFAAVTEGTRGLLSNINNLTSSARGFAGGFRAAFGGAQRDVGGLGNAVERVSGGIAGSWDGMLAGMGAGWDNTWTGIGRNFSGVVNRIIDGLNTMIGGINRIKIDIPRWLGGGSLGFNVPAIPNVPALAKGGIVSAPTLALVGEQGREAVLPLENNTGWMVNLANMLADAVAGDGSPRGGVQKVVLELDGRKLAEVLVDGLDEVKARRGY